MPNAKRCHSWIAQDESTEVNSPQGSPGVANKRGSIPKKGKGLEGARAMYTGALARFHQKALNASKFESMTRRLAIPLGVMEAFVKDLPR